jgi:hypothetical protein
MSADGGDRPRPSEEGPLKISLIAKHRRASPEGANGGLGLRLTRLACGRARRPVCQNE